MTTTTAAQALADDMVAAADAAEGMVRDELRAAAHRILLAAAWRADDAAPTEEAERLWGEQLQRELDASEGLLVWTVEALEGYEYELQPVCRRVCGDRASAERHAAHLRETDRAPPGADSDWVTVTPRAVW